MNDNLEAQLLRFWERQLQVRHHRENVRLLLASVAFKRLHQLAVSHEADEGPVAAKLVRIHLKGQIDHIPVVALRVLQVWLRLALIDILVHSVQEEGNEFHGVLLLVALQQLIDVANQIFELLRIDRVLVLPHLLYHSRKSFGQAALVSISCRQVQLRQVSLLPNEELMEVLKIGKTLQGRIHIAIILIARIAQTLCRLIE